MADSYYVHVEDFGRNVVIEHCTITCSADGPAWFTVNDIGELKRQAVMELGQANRPIFGLLWEV